MNMGVATMEMREGSFLVSTPTSTILEPIQFPVQRSLHAGGKAAGVWSWLLPLVHFRD
jgi:hypothetical protein